VLGDLKLRGDQIQQGNSSNFLEKFEEQAWNPSKLDLKVFNAMKST
jgi:hypothetical protein